MIRLLLALLLAGPVAAQEDLPEGYPPVMGTVTATVGDMDVVWQTYDFSVGAFDASAWVSDEDDRVTLRIMAYPEGKPQQMADRLRIVAVFSLFPSPGTAPETVLIEVLGDKEIDGRKLTAGTTPVMFTLDRFSRDSYAYGHTSGSFAATLCLKRSRVALVSRQCKPITGRFDTSIQFDNM